MRTTVFLLACLAPTGAATASETAAARALRTDPCALQPRQARDTSAPCPPAFEACPPTCPSAEVATAPEQRPVETLIGSDVATRFFFSVDTEVTDFEGRALNTTGFYLGWLLNERVVLDGAAYGSTNQESLVDLSYGGIVLEYFHDSSQLVNVSAPLLVGGGGVDRFRSRGPGGGFFLARPELRAFLNLTRRFRLGVGVAYRAVSGAGALRDELGGLSVSGTLTLAGF